MEPLFICASSSPRRKEILDFFTMPFTVQKPPFDEKSVTYQGNILSYVKKIAEGKALSLSSQLPTLSSDTVVYLEGKVYEKPRDDKDALACLAELNGKWHTVFTALSISYKGELFTEIEKTEVCFHKLDSEHLRRYHDLFQHNDKAGSYAIQKAGSMIVKEIKGCFYNVMGMPIHTLQIVLKKIGIDLWDYIPS